ncbi:uncharacterized protein lgals4 [Trichomycterus rosablanca]|uniref:uncharacterized protein lgals4 n=1 Tax=Trichomycterus rosablanca TaxID=2290929 RepID=UPI002F356BCE
MQDCHTGHSHGGHHHGHHHGHCGGQHQASTPQEPTKVTFLTGYTKPTCPFAITFSPEVFNPVIQPVIPYLGKIPGGLRTDMAVFFQGAVPPNSNEFDIRFQTGESNSDDVAFHLNPRIYANLMYMNTYRNGAWEKDESVYDKPMFAGESFNILIVIKSQGYEVYVNGLYLYLFKHRIPIEKVTTLTIRDDVFISVIGYINNWSTSSIYKDQQNTKSMGSLFSSLLPIPSRILNPVIMPKSPYFSVLPETIRQGMAFYIQGAVNLNATQFFINFQSGHNTVDIVDYVAFHFNPRIGQYVYMNTWIKPNWQKEELAAEKPFTKGTTFSILIVVKSENYTVYVNGKRHCSFTHRINLNNITALKIYGDVSIHFLGFVYNWSSPSFPVDEYKLAGFKSPSCVLPMLSELANVVIQPKIPFAAPIPGGIKSGMALYVRGTVPTDATQFAVNFQTKEKNGDVVFHFNPRFGQYLYLNIYLNGAWQKEELVYNHPFIKGATFILLVIIKSEGYEVYVNGMRQCIIKHRLPLEKSSDICIWGDVSVLFYGFIENWSKSSFFTDQPKITCTNNSFSNVLPVVTEISTPVIQPKIPYVGPITGGLRPGMGLYVEGSVPANANQFAVNLQTGLSTEYRGDEVAFHFDLRIGQYVYLNVFRNGVWEKEELVSDKPFIKGAAFNLLIAVHAENYEVVVNGVRHCTFKHRIPLTKVTGLYICGDVNINFFGFMDNWRRSCFFTKHPTITDTGLSFTSLLPVPSELFSPVIQPTLPYVGTINGGIKPGMAVFIRGAVPENAKGFEVNFQTGQSDGDNIAFHYNPRFGQYVYLNTFRNGNWEKEETVSERPLTESTSFTMFVVIKAERYEVYVNGFKQCMFKHRIPVENVSTLGFRGDVFINIYGFVENWSESSLMTSKESFVPPTISIPSTVFNPVIQPALPYVGPIKGGIKPDMALFFQGVIPLHAPSFAVHFQTGQSDGDDIAFHFNPHVGQCTYLNSFRNGSWEEEETAPDEPFTKGASFYMFIVINSDHYEVYVNGWRHCMFKHRIPIEKVSTLSVRGNVNLPVFGFIDNWSRFPFGTDQNKVKGMGSIVQPFSSLLPVPSALSYAVLQPALPHYNTLPGCLRPDMAVYFQGTFSAIPKAFEINFALETQEMAFHFNPRFGKKHVYLNSTRNGALEKEESAPIAPFTGGTSFTLFFLIKPECFEVYVNGLYHCTFNHRFPIENVSVIAAHGDFTINVYGFIENWSTSPFSADGSKITVKEGQSLLPVTPEISNSIVQPVLPHVNKISGKVKPDAAVYFQGAVPVGAKSFEINFQTGQSVGDEIAFHFYVLIGQYIRFNSFRNGSWEKEETVSSDKPFTKGGSFIMFVVIKSDGYEVYVNSIRIGMFKHRIPVDKVAALSIRGDVSLSLYGFIDNWKNSSFFTEGKNINISWSPSLKITLLLSEIFFQIVRPALPYATKIPGGIKPDTAVFFQGTVNKFATSFEINFPTGQTDGDDIGFQFKPLVGQNIYLNSFRNDTWEQEEIVPDKSFTKGAAFIIFVFIRSDGYEVYVNGVKLCMFKHRIPLENISTLSVNGDVSLSICGLINNWSSSSSSKEVIKITTPAASLPSIPAEVKNAVSNPTLPYVGKIPEAIKPEMAVFFQGNVPADAKNFTINFQTSQAAGADIAFQFNPRIGEKIYLNSFRNGSLEKEETVSSQPFTKGAAFIMLVVIKSDCYEVYINGVRHCTFNHRMPVEKVSTLGIRGDVSLSICGFINNWKTSSYFVPVPVEEKKTTVTWTTDPSSTPIKFEVSYPVSSPVLPYVGKMPGGIKQNMAVFFQGAVPAEAKSFTIDFLTGQGKGDDIAFQFNPRFGQFIYLNSFRNGSWEKEETTTDKPFTTGEAFIMFVVITSEGYEVYVNGIKHCMFKHRIPIEKVSTLGIRGDVSLSICGLINNWSSSSCFKAVMELTQTITVTSLKEVKIEVSQPISNPAIPYVGKIPIGVKQDVAIFVQGTVLANAKEFRINFQTGLSDGDDIAFHLNPRMGRYTALNSFRSGGWETEESAPLKPFDAGASFNIIIAIRSNGYEVYVNYQKFCRFNHRIPFEKVSSVGIKGDVSISVLGFIENLIPLGF